MILHTDLCDLLNIKYPLLQGAMAWIAGGKLAGAVSEAGGMGVIGTGNSDRNWLKKEIDIARSLTAKPFAVNLMLVSPHIDEIVDLVLQEKIPVVTTGGGNPGRYMESLKGANIKVIPVVASVALAKRLTRLGADALIAEGTESGGHIGEMTTMCIVPMVVDAVDIPVIAAGGIVDGRGVISALALGAKGVQIGTRFICAEECNAHDNYKQKVLNSKDRDTVVCGIATGHPVRAIHNPFTREYLAQEKSGANKEVLEELGRGRYNASAMDGDLEHGTILAGQICGMVNKIQPAADIVNEIMSQASEVQRYLGGILCQD